MIEILLLLGAAIFFGWVSWHLQNKERDELIAEAMEVRRKERERLSIERAGLSIEDTDNLTALVGGAWKYDEEDRKILLNSGNPLLIRLASRDAKIAYDAKREFARVYLKVDWVDEE